MADRYQTFANRLYYTTTTVEGWIDVFTRKEYVFELIENLKFCQEKKGLEIFAYVIMPNHIHMICRSQLKPLNHLLRDFKSFTAKKIIDMVKNNQQESRQEWLMYMFKFYGNKFGESQEYQFWRHGNHPIDLWSYKIIKQKLDYLHNNPVKAGYVDSPEHWRYSSAYPFPDIKISPLLY